MASAVKRIASAYGLEVFHAAELANLPLDIDVIITRRNEFPKLDRGRVLYREDFASVEDLVEKAVELTVVGSGYKLAVAAVDPGKSMGAIYLLDSKIIKSKRYRLIEDLVDDVKQFMRTHSDAEKKYLLVGATSNLQMVKRVLDEFEKHLRDEGLTIIVSDESFTGKGLIPRVKGMSKDEYAALILALKNLIKLR